MPRKKSRLEVQELEPRWLPSITAPATPVREAIPSLISTGVDSKGNVLAPGSTDPHWQIVSAPSPDTPGPAYSVIDNGFPFNGYWLPDDSSSAWIAPHPNENDFDNGATEPVGAYDYRTQFSLDGFSPSTAQISALIAGDNTVTQVLLNGHEIGFTSSDPKQYRALVSLAINSGFQSGVNTLDFIVQNATQTAWPDNLHNPSGFRAELSGTAEALPLDLLNPGRQRTAEKNDVSLQLRLANPDPNPVTFSATGLPAGLTINPTTGLISGKIKGSADETNGGKYTVTVDASDTAGATSSQTFKWTVTDADTKSDARIVKQGTVVPAKDIGGGQAVAGPVTGTVVARTGVEYTKGPAQNRKTVSDAISLSYFGANAGQVRIVQIFWREVLVTSGGQTKAVSVEFDSTAGKYQSTTDPNKPNYVVDSASKSPLYLSTGQGGYTSGKVMYTLDRPSDFAAVVHDKDYKNDATVTKIVTVGHYDWFVYYQGKPIYKVSWTSTATWEKGQAAAPPVIAVTGGGPNEGPNDAQIAALKAKNPDYAKFLTDQ